MEVFIIIMVLLLIGYCLYGINSSEVTESGTEVVIDTISENQARILLRENQPALAVTALMQGVNKGSYRCAVMLAEMATKYSLVDTENSPMLPEEWYEKAAQLDSEYHQHFHALLFQNHVTG